MAQALQLTMELDKASERRVKRALKKSGPLVMKNLRMDWNVNGLDFMRLMQNKHLSGGTTHNRLDRQSTTLFASIDAKTRRSTKAVSTRVYFKPAVEDYAAVHEYGGTIYPKKGEFLWFEVGEGSDKHLVRVRRVYIPPRMRLRQEWKKYERVFYETARKAVDRSLTEATRG